MNKDSGNESRRERRKAARLEKNKKKFDSWVQHHQLLKKEKTSNNKKAKNAQKSTQIAEEKESGKEDSTKLLETSSPHTLKETISAEDDLKLQRRLAKKLRVKDKNLSEGILSALESLETEGGEASRNTSTSRKKHKRRISSGDDIMAGDDQTNMSFEPKVLKKRKTKFEKYLELDTQNGVASAQEDLALERKLAKKLKLKEGKLRGDDDELNMLFEGISSVFDSLETEENADMEEASEVATKKKIPRKKRKKNSEQKEDAEIRSEDVVEGPESEITTGAELDSENNPAQASVPEVQAKYVPPQLRSMSRNESEEYSQVRKRVRGLLNRLSESNVEGIAGDMSTIFQSIARSVGAQIISEEILASCSGGPRGNEQYAAVFAALVSGLACLVGIDFGAKLLASLAKCFEDEYIKEDNLSLRNLTLLLSYLYIFGVCSSDLIYDFMMMLSSRLTEVDVSTILTILNCSGMRLRSDDPATMKNFILSIQNKVTELKAADGDNQAKSRSKRMEFMLETVVDIKNNKKRAKEDTLQHTRIKKWLQKLRVESILIRGLKWSKLIDPNKKGQWWLSGDMVSTTDNIENVAKKIDRESSEAQKMLQLAAGQRMNTDARRAIFCIVMSGDDYIDAFEKLLRLDLQGKQDREIMRVLVECCLQEKVFNKYYCVLVSKLCSHDKNHKFTLQYCIWDHYTELESMQLIRSMHLAKLVAEMVAAFTLSLAVLKKADLHDTTQLTSRKIMHFKIFFEAVFEYQDNVVWNIFKRIAGSEQYEPLRTGIKFFVERYVMGSEKPFAGKYKIAKKALKSVEEDIF
ncbi:nucleolar MIF4G domain-containing protein 1 [Cynara cardunculus var. scolymus]|uniref:nucleolar MIF4G domain-containing protein 1 n=1 Tax=Cynara cardunculus var. scolymus TaxID=59895 RepID=UPI000D625689|nr:nucleolar MIF4G domain-containing protein 1 [Cynara cardunculus var. scolymus]XP_024971738.1 nucleolar MIF4G domain-containing protein 1 [Cynara cardunculus var. scolymus]